jgi:biofilm PGA synthesis protein PgaD
MKPPIIDRPDLQSPAQRTMTGVLTLVFWSIWAYLCLPLLSLLAWAVGFHQAYFYMVVRGGHEQLLHVLLLCLAGIGLLGGALVLWASYNIVRYGKLPARAGRPPVPHEQIARYFRQGPVAVSQWQATQRLYVHHDEKGDIAKVEILPPVERVRTHEEVEA